LCRKMPEKDYYVTLIIRQDFIEKRDQKRKLKI